MLKDRLLELGLFSPDCQLAYFSQYGHPKRLDSAQHPLASSCTLSAQRDCCGDPDSWRRISKHSGPEVPMWEVTLGSDCPNPMSIK